jgi:hypothetical protein
MKARMMAAVAVVAILVAAFAATAGAASQTTIKGKLTSFTYKAASKTGALHVLTSKGTKLSIIVNEKTNCGVSFGQSGDQIPCKTLGKSKYAKKPVRVTGTRSSSGRVTATLVAVDLSK